MCVINRYSPTAPGPECDDDYCWNNGICNSDDECVCTSSYTGRYCRDEICEFAGTCIVCAHVCVCVCVCVCVFVHIAV